MVLSRHFLDVSAPASAYVLRSINLTSLYFQKVLVLLCMCVFNAKREPRSLHMGHHENKKKKTKTKKESHKAMKR